MKVRPYADSDWQMVCQIHDLARPLEVKRFMPTQVIMTMEEIAQEDGFFDSQCYVAETDGLLRGFICIQPPELTWLYVSPDYHRQGIGRALVEAVEEELGSDAWLTTAEENVEGVQFYKSLGFIVAATFPGHCQRYPCTCIRLVKPGSRLATGPPKPTQAALRLAGQTKDNPGRAVQDAKGVWRWM
ncbi:MAG: GNAT family N-acetyltransferase [Phormidesmis sp.]